MFKHINRILALLLCLALGNIAIAQDWKSAKYDTAWLPISKPQLQSAIRKNSKDAVALYQLWRRARYQKLTQTAFDTFRQLKNEQPANANMLAIYCMAVEQRVPDDGKPRFEATPQELDVETRRMNIERLKKLNPKLWMAYAVQGRFEYNTTIFKSEDQVRIYKKALSLAPNLSITNDDYSNALADFYFQKKQPLTNAIAYRMRAQRLAPVSCEPSWGLIMMYHWHVPNAAKEKQAAQAYTVTIPPNTKFTPERRKSLAQWGIKVP